MLLSLRWYDGFIVYYDLDVTFYGRDYGSGGILFVLNFFSNGLCYFGGTNDWEHLWGLQEHICSVAVLPVAVEA